MRVNQLRMWDEITAKRNKKKIKDGYICPFCKKFHTTLRSWNKCYDKCSLTERDRKFIEENGFPISKHLPTPKLQTKPSGSLKTKKLRGVR